MERYRDAYHEQSDSVGHTSMEAAKVGLIIEDKDVTAAETLEADADAVDRLHRAIFEALLRQDQPYAATILVTVGNASTFPAAGHLASYAGLAPVTKSSGSSIRGEHAPRRGNRQLKRAMLRLARRRINVLHAMLRDGAFYASRTLSA